MTEATLGREPETIVELVQPWCSLTYGTAPCTATGTPKCYQTWTTCRDRNNIDFDDQIVWRFRMPDAGIRPMYEEGSGVIKTNPIPLLRSVSVSSSELNTGAMRSGQSPLGIRASCEVDLADAPWDDHVGDKYLADRAGVRGGFWQKWRARNAFYPGCMIRVYEGYKGQALGDMTRRDYVLREVVGPAPDGSVTLRGIDPLGLAEERRAMFPRSTDLRLVTDIDAATGTIFLNGLEADVADAFGNTGARRFLRLGSEVIEYTGYVPFGASWLLTGVVRARFGTFAAAHSRDTAAQRCGRYEAARLWEVAADLIDNHTPIPAGYRDATEWSDEGNVWMITQRGTATITAPTPVERLLGELCQQGNFMIWWDDRRQKIPLLANRPPSGTVEEIEAQRDVIFRSQDVKEDADAQISRVAIYYAPINPFDIDKPENYRVLRLNVNGAIEQGSREIRTLTIYARWVQSDGVAARMAARLLLRYGLIPRYLTLELDATRRATSIGDVLAVTSHAITDSEGNPISARWQVVATEEPRPGHSIRLRLQSYLFIGRFCFIMPPTANDYASATDEEKATGGFMADATTGLMPNGDPPYLIQ